MTRHSHMQRFQSEIQNIGALGRLHTAKVTHQLGGTFGDKGSLFSELFCVGNAVIRFIRGAKPGEFVRMGHPVKFTGIHDRSAYGSTMAVHVLGGGVCHDIRPPFDGSAIDRCGECIVYNERYTMIMSGFCKLLNIKNRKCRIGNGLSKNGSRIVPESSVKLLLAAVGRDKGCRNSHLCHGNGNQVKGSAVNRRGCHNMTARLTDVEECEEIGCLSRRSQHGSSSSFQLGNLSRHIIVGRILQSGIEISVCFQIK